MRILIACFFVLFALAELFDWLQQLSLPMPIYILGGAFLAIASNYNKRFGSFFGNDFFKYFLVIHYIFLSYDFAD